MVFLFLSLKNRSRYFDAYFNLKCANSNAILNEPILNNPMILFSHLILHWCIQKCIYWPIKRIDWSTWYCCFWIFRSVRRLCGAIHFQFLHISRTRTRCRFKWMPKKHTPKQKVNNDIKVKWNHKIFYKNLRCFAKYAFDVVYVKTIVWYCLHLRCDEIRHIRLTWVIGLKREWDKWNSTKIIISSHDKKKRIINIILNDRFKINLWLIQTVSQWHELEQCDQYNKCFPLPRTSSSSRALFWAKFS